MTKWTPQQKQAIEARNRTILVSAAAGSGKTAVLIERIIQLIREGYHVNRMLIVTFTKAAAGEMKMRLNRDLLREAQSDPAVFSQALDDLESTEISTIHAFCQKVIRNHFQTIGIDPMVRPCEEQLRHSLFHEAWLEAFNQLLEGGDDESFIELANAWDQAHLQQMTEDLHDFLMSLPAPFDWLDRAVGIAQYRPFERHPWYVTMKEHARMMLGGVSQLLQQERELLDEQDAIRDRMDTWLQDCDDCASLECINWNRMDETLSDLDGFKLSKLKPLRGLTDAQKEWQKKFSKVRDDIKGIVKDIHESIAIDEERFEREFSMIHCHLKGLSALVKRTDELFLAKKAEKHVIDFSDMEQFTMQILSDPRCRAQLQEEYDHIFVDECQDVSQIQDAILQSIHSEKNFMFMVGDVKQSIYRFRKADPTLFLHRLRTYSDDPDAETRRIILQKNFRSRYNVLEATNQVFRKTMRPEVTELTYEPEDELICGRETTDDPPVEIHLLDVSPGEDGEKMEALAAEAKVVADRISELLNESFDDGKTVRNYTYRDMVILLSAASNTAPRLVELLSAKGIPVFYDGASAYYALQEIQAVKSLLSVLDNPMQDIPLLASLKMPPFSFTETDFAHIRLCKTGKGVPFADAFAECCEQDSPLAEKCRAFRDQLRTWRFECESMRLSDFVWHIIRKSGFYAACGALPKGELRQANLRMLYQRALDFEATGGETLSEFIAMMDRQAQSDDRMTAKILGESENLVRIMTMHKSKGLEFPVVFCMQMSGKLHKGQKGDMMMHTKLGVALPYVNRALNIRRHTLADQAFRVQRELDEKAERARLLYVAMTRARDRLIIVGCCSNKERRIWTLPESDYRVWKASSMTDWIMQGDYAQIIHKLSTNDPLPETPCKFSLYDNPEGLTVDNSVDKQDVFGWVMTQVGIHSTGMNDHWDDMDKTEQAPPLKTSVSAIAKKMVLEDPLPLSDAEEDVEKKRDAEQIVSPLRMSELPSRPAFLEERHITGAEKGTILHRLLSLISLKELAGKQDMYAAIHRSAHEMMERGIFTAQELMLLNMEGAADFFRSSLGRRLLASDCVRREWSFNLLMDEQSETLLQGVIDCAFHEDGGWILLDYKTDYIVDEDAFCQRYAMQIEWYARALEKISGEPVKEMWLYAIGKRKAYPMERIRE